MAGPVDEKKIQDAVREKYAQVSKSASGKFNYPTGRDGAIQQGYDPAVIQSMPEELIESFCGVGNPFKLGAIKSGETVLDVGCGAGFDLIVASRMVGQDGKVCGIDAEYVGETTFSTSQFTQGGSFRAVKGIS